LSERTTLEIPLAGLDGVDGPLTASNVPKLGVNSTN
jgi:hypothetical protein